MWTWSHRFTACPFLLFSTDIVKGHFPQILLNRKHYWTSLVVQWLGICLPMQRTWIRPLVREDSTCRGSTKPVRLNKRSQAPKLEKAHVHQQRGAKIKIHKVLKEDKNMTLSNKLYMSIRILWMKTIGTNFAFIDWCSYPWFYSMVLARSRNFEFQSMSMKMCVHALNERMRRF